MIFLNLNQVVFVPKPNKKDVFYSSEVQQLWKAQTNTVILTIGASDCCRGHGQVT